MRGKTLTDLLNPAWRLRCRLLLVAGLWIGVFNACVALYKASRRALTFGAVNDAVLAIPALGRAAIDMVNACAIAAQSNPRSKVEATLNRISLKIGGDPLFLSVKSSHDGYGHLLLGSDNKSFDLLFRNAPDAEERIKANQTLSLPRPDWEPVAHRPLGTDQLLMLVFDTPRDLTALTALPPDSAVPFTFSLNNLPGRAELIDFFAGLCVSGGSESFGAKLLSIKETK